MGYKREIVGARPKAKDGERDVRGARVKTASTEFRAEFCLMCIHKQIHFRFLVDSEKDMVRKAEEYLTNNKVPLEDWKNFAIMRNMEDVLGGPIWVAWRRPW